MELKIKEGVTITRKQLYELYVGFEHFFLAGGVYVNTPIDKWKDRNAFIKDVEYQVGVDISKATYGDIKKFEETLEKIAVDDKTVESNRPTNEQLKVLEEEERARTEAKQKSDSDSKKAVEKSIEKKEELAAKARKTSEKTPQPAQPTIEEQQVTFTPQVSYIEVKDKSVKIPPNVVVQEVPEQRVSGIPAVLEPQLRKPKTFPQKETVKETVEPTKETPQPAQPIREEQISEPIPQGTSVMFQEPSQKKQHQIQSSLKDKKVIVVPTEDLKKVNLTLKEKEQLFNLAQAVKTDPGTLQKIIEQKISESVNKSSPEIRKNINQPIITRAATDLVEKLKPFTVFEDPSKIPNTFSIQNPVSPLVSISNPNDPKLISMIPDNDLRRDFSQSVQSFSAAIEAKNNINYSLTKPLFEGTENISEVFYPQQIAQYQFSEKQEQEKDGTTEIDLQNTYNKGKDVWDFWQKIKNGATTVDETITSTATIPYSSVTTTTVSEASSFAIAGLPTTVGAIVGFSVTTLPSYYISFSTPLLTAPVLTQTLAPVFSLPATIATSAPSVLTYTRFIDGVETQIFSSIPSNMTIFTAKEVAAGVPGTLGTEAISQIGGTAARQSLNVTIGNAVVKGASLLAEKLGATALAAKIGAAYGTGIVPVIGTIVGALIGAIAGKIIEKIPWKKVKEWGAAIIGGVTGLIALPFLGIGSAIGIGLGATAVSAGLGAGLGGATLAGVGSGIAGFFSALGGAFLGAIGMPILVTLLVFSVVVALILFIINSGAYIVPPTSSTGAYNTDNPYVSVEKTASPKGPFENSDLPLTVEYTIKITAKISPLNNVRLDYKCEVLKKNANTKCPDIGDAIPKTDEIGTISPSNSYSFKYSMTYSGNSFTDTFVSDTITATVDTPEKKNTTTSGSASVIIGKPDVGCYKVITTGQYAVPPQYMKMYNDSIFKIVQDWPSYVAKTCPANGGQVNIGYGGPNAYWGWHIHQSLVDFILYQQPVSTTLVRTEFVMIHELAHHINKVNADYYIQYKDYPNIVIPICSYSATESGPDATNESFAETIGLYGSGRSLTDTRDCAGATSFKEKYPVNWKFADEVIFH